MEGLQQFLKLVITQTLQIQISKIIKLFSWAVQFFYRTNLYTLVHGIVILSAILLILLMVEQLLFYYTQSTRTQAVAIFYKTKHHKVEAQYILKGVQLIQSPKTVVFILTKQFMEGLQQFSKLVITQTLLIQLSKIIKLFSQAVQSIQKLSLHILIHRIAILETILQIIFMVEQFLFEINQSTQTRAVAIFYQTKHHQREAQFILKGVQSIHNPKIVVFILTKHFMEGLQQFLKLVITQTLQTQFSKIIKLFSQAVQFFYRTNLYTLVHGIVILSTILLILFLVEQLLFYYTQSTKTQAIVIFYQTKHHQQEAQYILKGVQLIQSPKTVVFILTKQFLEGLQQFLKLVITQTLQTQFSKIIKLLSQAVQFFYETILYTLVHRIAILSTILLKFKTGLLILLANLFIKILLLAFLIITQLNMVELYQLQINQSIKIHRIAVFTITKLVQLEVL